MLKWSARLTTAVLISIPGLAFAQGNVSVAEGLFRDGRELMDKGDYAAACPKLRESQRLDPSPGTLLNLAACEEKQGKTASAWASYLAAARLARTQNRTNIAEEAKQRAAELEPKVSYLKIVLSERVPGIQVKIDDVSLESAALGSKIPVDPGERTVSIGAPGHKTLEMKIKIGTDHDSQTVNVPKLEPGESGASPSEPTKPATKPAPGASPVLNERDAAGPPIVAYVVGGVGVVALGVGTAFAFMAKSAYDDAEGKCPTKTGCGKDAVDLRDKAETRANIANIGVGLGIVGIGVGAVLLLTHSPGKRERPPASAGFHSLRVSPFASGTSAGVAISGVTF
ncbi:MAG: hypothetical protein IPI67_17035 [Myxococcales bacterium]|nr:hypothetical protein [Myxococcales bacterium]